MTNAGHIFVRKSGTRRARVSNRSDLSKDAAPVSSDYLEHKKTMHPKTQEMIEARKASHEEKMRAGIESQVNIEKQDAERANQSFNKHQRQKHWENVADRIDNKGIS